MYVDFVTHHRYVCNVYYEDTLPRLMEKKYIGYPLMYIE